MVPRDGEVMTRWRILSQYHLIHSDGSLQENVQAILPIENNLNYFPSTYKREITTDPGVPAAVLLV